MAFFTLYHLTNWLYLQKPQLSNLGETRCWLILVNNSLCSIPLYTRLYKITPGDRCGGEPAWPRHATLDSSHFLHGCLTWHGHAASWTIGGPRMYGRLLVRCWMTVFCLNCMTVMMQYSNTRLASLQLQRPVACHTQAGMILSSPACVPGLRGSRVLICKSSYK